MLMTGSKDGSPLGSASPEQRREVYPALPEGDKFELVLEGAEHFSFSEVVTRAQKQNPNHHLVIQALSTAFWETYLMENPEAQLWLKGDEPRKLMEDGDRWQKK